MKNIMMEVCDSVQNGLSLSQSLAKHPGSFDNVFVGLVAAGEKSGQIGEAFAQLLHHFKWSNKINKQIKKATYYPMFLFTMLGGVIMLMMNYVVPQLTEFLKDLGATLPFHTKVLIAVSDFLSSHATDSVIFIVSMIVLYKILRRVSKVFNELIDRLVYRLPVIGDVNLKIEISRFCRFFSLSYKSGLDVLECFHNASKVLTNSLIRNAVSQSQVLVSEGSNIASALKATNVFPPFVVRIFAVGERSGKLEMALENVNEFYEEEVQEAIDKMIASVQPFITVVMGFMIGWIVVSVFGPIYDTIGQSM